MPSPPISRRNESDGSWLSALVVLTAAIAVTLVPLVLRCGLDGQIDYSEGWNAYRQQAAAYWHPLYGAPPGNAITNYPPLSFHLIGLIGRLCGNIVLTGRVIALVALASIAALAARIGHFVSSSRSLGASCALFWIAGIVLFTPSRVGADDPQFLAMTFETLALSMFTVCKPGRHRYAWASSLMCLGLFTKHNLVALPLGITASLALRRDWRGLITWLLSGLVTSSVLLVGSVAMDGRYLMMHLLTPRLFLPTQAIALFGIYMLLDLPALVMVAAWARRGAVTTTTQPLLLCWLAALLEIAVFAGGDGVATNIYQDAILMTAILQPVALEEWARLRRISGSSAQLARLAVVLPWTLILGLLAPHEWSSWHVLAQQQSNFRTAVALLHAQPGAVACETLLLCFEAGKSSEFDAYYVMDQIALGRMPGNRIESMLSPPLLNAIAIGAADDPASGHSRRFTASFLNTLRAKYRISLRSNTFVIYKPILPFNKP